MIDWESKESQVFLNPRLEESQKNELLLWFKQRSIFNHIWLCSSGTTGKKLVALSKPAMLCSAKAVNDQIQSSSKDIWVNPLPPFHVGGLGIYARAYLSKSKVFSITKWDPKDFIRTLLEKEGTLSSLVPTQLWDLVNQNYVCPPTVRVVFVGGGALSDSLKSKAMSLHWPVIATYGMTECCSQVATGTTASSNLTLLPHIEAKIVEGELFIKSDSLLTGWVKNGVWEDPKVDLWYQTGDLGVSHKRDLKIHGRKEEMVKILGECVYLNVIRNQLEEILPCDFHLCVKNDERRGGILELKVVGSKEKVMPMIDSYHKGCLPFERIQNIVEVHAIPRTDLGKIKI
jgi:O-succinylbenzoic acid--CoA ligase